MTAPQTSPIVWRRRGSIAEFHCGNLRGGLATDAGQEVRDLRLGEQRLPGALWRVATGLDALEPLSAPSEQYARDDDFVTTHPASGEFPFRVQLQWSTRRASDSPCVTITLTISLQTDLLDTRPRLALVSTVAASEHGATTDAALSGLGRWVGDDARCLEVVHPLDRDEFVAEQRGGQHLLRWSPPFLEKGVIRRCRLAALFAPLGVGDDAVLKTYDEFARAELPLTA